jgi:hypothetical protein
MGRKLPALSSEAESSSLAAGNAHEHLVPAAAHARMNGIVPPWTAAQMREQQYGDALVLLTRAGNVPGIRSAERPRREETSVAWNLHSPTRIPSPLGLCGLRSAPAFVRPLPHVASR